MPLVDADRLKSWGETSDAENRLPELLMRLAAATAGPQRKIGDFRTGHGTHMGGYDGFTDVVAGSAYLPDGPTVWELGTGDGPGKKAQDDYEKRTEKSGMVDPLATTYVAVTSRRWGGRADWEADRSGEHKWKDVRALDADSLYAWLLQARTAHLWLSEYLKTQPDGAVTPEEWWTEYRFTVRPATEPSDVTQGRKTEMDRLLERMGGGAEVVQVHGRDLEEAIAFIVATVLQATEPDQLLLLSRMSIVEGRDAWRQTVRYGSTLILVPAFPAGELPLSAAGRGHICLVPVTQDHDRTMTSIVLPPLPALGVARRLEAAGATPPEAEVATRAATQSVTDLRLALESVSNPGSPEWARPGSARKLAPFVLAGQWNDSFPEDRAVLQNLSGRSYAELTDTLVEWRFSPRPPVTKSGSIWAVGGRAQVWDWLHQTLVEDDLRRFQEISAEILREEDPRYELDTGQRWMAGAMGKKTKNSEQLREGLADGLAMLGGTSTTHPADGALSGQDLACFGVRGALQSADWKRWASLSPLLSLLAEACPDEFLSAVERDVAGEDPPLAQIFTDSEKGLVATSSPHSGLLFALERLGRSPSYLSRVAVALARLVQLDPGGVLANRPGGSLIHLLQIGLPQTGATAQERLAVVDMLRQRVPDIAWDTMLGMLPTVGAITIPSASPRWRVWPVGGEA
jgi:hypothetical protein